MKILILLILFFAAVEDIKKMEVGYIYPASILILSFINVLLNPYINLNFMLLNSLLIFIVLFLFWLLGGIGGGDVKILTALAFYAGFKIWDILLFSSLIFLLYSLALRKFKAKIPFMPAVVAGTIISFFVNF
ncbi:MULTISPECIES: prepilin peptidase [Thermoanaerobacter]|uniref:Peptidase A24A, prepilin type IV n=2 Tax=Thermoanaerobacter TaxID=1754 RepID=B0K814_THEP3|nr:MULTISPECIES: A24 family peptidase [Thermoanaerobacter]ABY95834.1 peptidase A24A, prepilin type IV [Thermoanaerobacter pseudethanolicus ATCC 33223]ADV80756.1 peptidase A24A prepilin type IV [Thermoanaerobacter brockii subsp. finnii Ako-1]